MNESVVVKGVTAAPLVVESRTSRYSSSALPNSGIIENFREAESMDDCRLGKEDIPVLLR